MAYELAELESQGWSKSNAKKFKAWMEALDAKVAASCQGMTTQCFPDWDFAASFESGESVEDAFVCWCEDNGFPAAH